MHLNQERYDLECREGGGHYAKDWLEGLTRGETIQSGDLDGQLERTRNVTETASAKRNTR